MASTAPVHNFAARCPHGHRPPQSWTLAELRDPGVRFYCRLCAQTWTPRVEERTRALGFAEASEDQVQPPPFAA